MNKNLDCQPPLGVYAVVLSLPFSSTSTNRNSPLSILKKVLSSLYENGYAVCLGRGGDPGGFTTTTENGGTA